jgi:hypothetical protein
LLASAADLTWFGSVVRPRSQSFRLFVLPRQCFPLATSTPSPPMVSTSRP